MAFQLYRGGDRERDQRTRQWRAERIKRFTERQRRTRDWINFSEIAEWCSKEGQSIVPDEEKSAVAFDTLASDLLAGEFEEGRSRVLYLHPATTKARMTRELLQDAMDHNYDGDQGRSAYLAHCWIPRSLFQRWLAKHRLRVNSPCMLEHNPEAKSSVPAAKAGRPPKPATPPSKPGRKPQWDWLKPRAIELMNKNGDFFGGDPKWNTKTCLDRALLALCGDKGPAPSTLGKLTKRWVEKWRQMKKASRSS